MELERYFTREAYFDGEQFRHTGVRVKLGLSDDEELSFDIEYKTDKKQGYLGWNIISDYDLEIIFSDIDQIRLLSETIEQWLNTDSTTRIRKNLGMVSGVFRDRMHHTFDPNKEDFISKVDSLETVVRSDGIELICQNSGEYIDTVYIPGTTEERNSEDLNIDNIESFQELLEEYISYYDSGLKEKELPVLINTEIERELTSSKYGQEVLIHLQEGDRCFESELYNPALGSYIHSIEWVIISYLKSHSKIDIIEREQNGQLYYFARGGNSLLDELTRNAAVDQKTISKLKSMNRAERRWMAHHKEGSTLPEDVIAVRARLGELLQTLYL